MAAKTAKVSESMEDDVVLTPEEDASLKAQQGDETPPEPAPPPEPKPPEDEGKAVKEVFPELPKIPEVKAKGKKTEETVPYERLEQLNQRLKEAEEKAAQAASYQEKWARLEERQKLAREAAEAAKASAEAAERAKQRPDPDVDATGARAWDAEQRAIASERAVSELRQQLNAIVQQQQGVNANYEMQNWLAFQVPQARSRFSDYDTRVDYARAARAAWWASVFQLPDGRQVQLFSPEMARDITAREEMVLLERARQLGIPVADAVVRLSDTWGYQGWLAQQQAARTQQPVAVVNGNANGQVRQAAPPQVLPSANEKLAQIEKGQAVQGLGRVQSGEQNAQLSWQTMNPLEFKTFVGNMPEDRYIEMLADPRFGKLFEQRVGEIDLTDLNA